MHKRLFAEHVRERMSFLLPSQISFLPDPYHSYPQLLPRLAKMGIKGQSWLGQHPEYRQWKLLNTGRKRFICFAYIPL